MLNLSTYEKNGMYNDFQKQIEILLMVAYLISYNDLWYHMAIGQVILKEKGAEVNFHFLIASDRPEYL